MLSLRRERISRRIGNHTALRAVGVTSSDLIQKNDAKHQPVSKHRPEPQTTTIQINNYLKHYQAPGSGALAEQANSNPLVHIKGTQTCTHAGSKNVNLGFPLNGTRD